MIIIKYIFIILLFFACAFLGKTFSKKFSLRLSELEDMKSALSIFETKIKFTYEPIPEIFNEISNNNLNDNISNIFINASKKMKLKRASDSWNEAVEETNTNLNKEDKNSIKTFSKLLGQTDIEGQVAQIKVTQDFLQKQINDASNEKEKNQKLYNKLGVVLGLMLVILLI